MEDRKGNVKVGDSIPSFNAEDENGVPLTADSLKDTKSMVSARTMQKNTKNSSTNTNCLIHLSPILP